MSEQLPCAGCELGFTPARRNQKYCSRKCQKNATRGCRRSEYGQMAEIHYARVTDLSNMIYSVAINQRLGVMKEVLDCVPHDSGLRRILTDPSLLKVPPRPDNRMNIAKAASEYTKKFFGVSIVTYIRQVKAGTVNDESKVQRTRHIAAPERPPVARQPPPKHKLKYAREAAAVQRRA